MYSVVPNISKVDQIVSGEGVLESCHPLFHIRRMPNRIDDRVEPETDIGQSALGISLRWDFTARESIIQGFIRSKLVVERVDPWGGL